MTSTPWNAYLRDFHRAIPNATSANLARFTNAAGRCSYELLAETLSDGDMGSAISVLDLGCGDGYLTDEIVRTCGPRAAIHGIDVCEAEIERAIATRSVGSFQVADATALPFAAGSFDAILSHFAFMLMVPIDRAIAEIERTLTPAGRFITILSRLNESTGDLAALLALLGAAKGGRKHAAVPAFDKRQFSADGIAELFEMAGSRRRVDVQRHEATAVFGAAGAFTYLSHLYFFDSLSETEQLKLRLEIDELAASRGGSLVLTQHLELISMR